MNEIVIMGRLTRDPELKSTGNGVEVCNFSVAVDRPYGDKENKKTDFIECTAWRKTGVFVEKYFHRGDGIAVKGSLQSEKYTDKDGNNRTSWKVVVDSVYFPPSKSSSGSASSGSTDNYEEIGEEEELPF